MIGDEMTLDGFDSCYEMKKRFVTKYLAPLVQAADGDIIRCRYHWERGRSGIVDEHVGVVYIDGHELRINVAGDSNMALCRDVLAEL